MRIQRFCRPGTAAAVALAFFGARFGAWAVPAGTPANPAPPAVPAAPAAAPEPSPESLRFDPSLLVLSGVDLSRYDKASYMPPGLYSVGIRVNGRLSAFQEVRFVAGEDGQGLQPCLDAELVRRLGIDAARAPQRPVGNPALAECHDVFSTIEQAKAWFDGGEFSLELSVPQATLVFSSSAAPLDPALLDNGVPAFALNYFANSYWYRYGEVRPQLSHFLQLDGHGSIGPWRLGWSGNGRWATHNGFDWTNQRAVVERAINPIGGWLSLGQTQSGGGSVLAGVPIIGARLASEQGLMPGYNYQSAVRGVARSQARVVLRQQGRVVYETTVPPGPFDLTAFRSAVPADVEVSVEEQDGTTSRFVVPYIRPAQLLEPGRWTYDAAIGRAQFDLPAADTPWVLQAGAMHGLTPTITTYGGLQVGRIGSRDWLYTGAMLGATAATPYGVFSADFTRSQTSLSFGGHEQSIGGNSIRLSYQYTLQSTGSDLTLASYRYNGGGFMSLPQAAAMASGAPPSATAAGGRQRLDLAVGQTVWGGRLSVGGSWTNAQGIAYGGLDEIGAQRYLYANYTRMFGDTTLSLQLRNGSGNEGVNGGRGGSHYVGLTLSVPLGSARSSSTRWDQSFDRTDGIVRSSTSVSGQTSVAGVPVGLGGTVTTTLNDLDTSVNLNAGLQLDNADVAMGVAGTSRSRSWSASASGGLLIHADGVTFSRTLPDTLALVEVPGGAGARVNGQRIDGSGHAVTGSTPFQDQALDVDTAGASTDLELQTTRKSVQPARGAVVKVKFDRLPGQRVLIQTTTDNGQPLPFGAEVTDAEGHEVGLVGQGGSVFARVLQPSGRLHVSWGTEASEACELDYAVPQAAGKELITQASAACRRVHRAGEVAQGAVAPAGATGAR